MRDEGRGSPPEPTLTLHLPLLSLLWVLALPLSWDWFSEGPKGYGGRERGQMPGAACEWELGLVTRGTGLLNPVAPAAPGIGEGRLPTTCNFLSCED